MNFRPRMGETVIFLLWPRRNVKAWIMIHLEINEIYSFHE